MNNDNEKDLLETNPEEVTEEITEDISQDTVAETEETEAVAVETEADECACGCCDCEAEAEINSEGAQDTDDALCHTPTGDYGPLSHGAAETAKPKRTIVTPIIIAAVAFVLVAAIVFGGIWIYKAFFGTSLKGIWEMQGYEGTGSYFEFDDEGNVYLRGGGISYFGTYETATYDVDTVTEVPDVITNLSAVEALSGDVNVLKTDFYLFGMYGGQFVYSLESVDGVKTINLKTVDSSTGTVSELVLVKSELPELKIDPSVITNASADEAGITTLQIDNNMLGTWSEPAYGTYTFYEDGTANYRMDYQVDQSYAMFYGITMGYGTELDFRYTVNDGTIYMSVDYYTGDTADGVMTYYLDGDNLVIDGVGYTKVEAAQ